MSRRYILLLVLTLTLLVASGCAPAESALEITDPWARSAALEAADSATGEMDESDQMDEMSADSADSAPTVGHNGPVSAAYMTIRNTGGAADRLLSASTAAAGIVEIHTVEMENDIMRMRPLVDGLEIPAGGEVALQPGGYHIMLMNLQEALVAGETLSLTLTFQSGKELSVEAEIRAP